MGENAQEDEKKGYIVVVRCNEQRCEKKYHTSVIHVHPDSIRGLKDLHVHIYMLCTASLINLFNFKFMIQLHKYVIFMYLFFVLFMYQNVFTEI